MSGLLRPTFEKTVRTSGRGSSVRSTKRTAESVVAIVAPSGASTCTRYCGSPALGKSEKPIAGTSVSDARKSPSDAATVVLGRASAACSHLP